jgi:pimeloyl-ACP methyl ester carboxylesterase
MPALEARGVEIAWSEQGEGSPVVLVHETAVTGAVWDPLAGALAGEFRAIAYDRRGWGGSSEPDDYRRTTIEEQSEDAAALIEATADDPAVVCGAGVGAVICLDLLLRRSELVSGAVLIEPLLFQLTPSATESLSQDRQRIEIAAANRESVIDVYLTGGLPALGPGVARTPDETAAAARARPRSVVAELGIPAGWRMPLPRLASAERPSAIVTAESTPPLLREAAQALAARLAGTSAQEVSSPAAPPHIGAPAEVASIVAEVSP